MKQLTPEQFEKEHKKDLEALHRGIAYELSEQMIDNAPSDTGKLKGSINMSTNEGEVITDNPDPSGSQTKNRILNNLKQASIDDDLYGTVGEEYARYVDGGTSDQPPNGFFTVAINSLSNIVKKASRNLKKYRDR